MRSAAPASACAQPRRIKGSTHQVPLSDRHEGAGPFAAAEKTACRQSALTLALKLPSSTSWFRRRALVVPRRCQRSQRRLESIELPVSPSEGKHSNSARKQHKPRDAELTACNHSERQANQNGTKNCAATPIKVRRWFDRQLSLSPTTPSHRTEILVSRACDAAARTWVFMRLYLGFC